MLTLSRLQAGRFFIQRLAIRQQVGTLTGSPVAHGGDPQDRAGSPTAQEGKSPEA